MAANLTNLAVVTVGGLHDDADTAIALSSGHRARLPNPATVGTMALVWWDSTNYTNPEDDPNVEIVHYTAQHASADTLTVTRGAETIMNGQVTTPSTKNTGAATYKMRLVWSAELLSTTKLNLGTEETLTNTSNTITITGSNHVVDTSSSAQTVGIINGGVEGDILIIGPSSDSNRLVFDDQVASSNLEIPLDSEAVLSGVISKATFIFNGTNWVLAAQPGYHPNIKGATRTVTVSAETIDADHASYVTIDMQGGTKTVSTINGGVAGKICVFTPNSADQCTFTDGANLDLAGNFLTNSSTDTITLIATSTNTWRELSRSDN